MEKENAELRAKNEQLEGECADLMQEVFRLREIIRDYDYVSED